MEKIAIIGCCGAGKSTLASNLGLKLNLPVIHLDRYYWQTGWVESTQNEWIAKQKLLVKGDRWIVDGNYLATMDIRLLVADTVILLDFPRWLCLWRIIKRYSIYKDRVRPDMADDCVERLNWDFWLYVWNFAKIQRQSILSKLELYRDSQQIIILSNPQQVSNFLFELNRLV